MNKIFAIGMFLAAMMTARGTSIIFPTYSTPIFVDGTLMVLSPDRMLLLGVSRTGETKWKQRLPSRGAICKHKSGKLLLITGSTASGVNPRSGKMDHVFQAQPGVTNLQYVEESDFFFGETESWGSPALIVYDGSTHESLLKQRLGETVAYADQEIIVLAKGKRKKENDGYSFSKGWMEVFSRKTGKQIWSADFKNQQSPYHSTCRVGDYVVCEDGDDLMVIHAANGKLTRRPADKPTDSIGPSGIRSEKGALVYVASELNYSDFNKSKQTIYRVSIPDLKTIETKVVEVIEAARAETSGDFTISDSLYRTACFRRDGSKVWEHFQMHRTGVIGGLIYFSDFDKGVARMGSLEVATGKERILISERVKMKE